MCLKLIIILISISFTACSSFEKYTGYKVDNTGTCANQIILDRSADQIKIVLYPNFYKTYFGPALIPFIPARGNKPNSELKELYLQIYSTNPRGIEDLRRWALGSSTEMIKAKVDETVVMSPGQTYKSAVRIRFNSEGSLPEEVTLHIPGKDQDKIEIKLVKKEKSEYSPFFLMKGSFRSCFNFD